jgi:hypothetical protein
MLKPPTWVQPRREWERCSWRPDHYRVEFHCGCGASWYSYLPEGEKPTTLACDQCRRRERKRLSQREWRGSDVPHDPRPCGHCGETFQPERTTARYCSTRCRVAANRAKKK